MRIAVAHSRIWRETLLALVVLALAFLNFGHQSAVLAAGGRVVVTDHSICGDAGTLPAAGDHFACHACRPDAAMLPPEPCTVDPVLFALAPVTYAAPLFAWHRLLNARPGNPRGPPSI